MSKIPALGLVGLVALFAAACASVRTTQPGVVGVDRKQTMSSFVSEAQMQQGAAEAYKQVLAEAQQKKGL